MKRLKLGILSILLIFLTISTFGADLKLVSFPTGYFKGDTLVNITTNKVPGDTLLINFVDFPNYGDFDSFMVYLKMDTVAGLYGGAEADSLGRSAIGIYARPLIKHPARVSSYETVTFLDTISGEGWTTLEDSVLVTGITVSYVAPIRFPQYYIYIKHSSGDTSNVNAQARTVYRGWIGLKKKSRLVNIDLLEGITGNPDLDLNSSALGDVRLFDEASSIADGDDGQRLIIFRKEDGDEDSLEFYISSDGEGYIKGSNDLILDVSGTVYLDAGSGRFYFKDVGTTTFMIGPDKTYDQVLFLLYSSYGNHIVIGNDYVDYDIPFQNNPLFAIFSDLNPDISNNHSLRFYHDSTGGVIATGDSAGIGSAPDTIDNYIMFMPQGVEAMKIAGTGVITMDSSLTVAYSVTGSEFINASKMFIGKNPIDKLKLVTHKKGTEDGDWATIDHEKLPEGVKVPIVKQYYKDKITGNEVWKPEMNSYISRVLEPYVEDVIYMDEDSVEQTTYRNVFKDNITGKVYIAKRDYINEYYKLINKQAYGESLTGIVDIMRNAILELKAETDLLRERIFELEKE